MAWAQWVLFVMLFLGIAIRAYEVGRPAKAPSFSTVVIAGAINFTVLYLAGAFSTILK